MSNKARKKSPLTTFERISPNSTRPRTGRIRRNTPHCVAGNLTIESTLGLERFIKPDPKNGASCNYAVGTDGRIGLGVEEINRSWCTASQANDQEAITTEIANNTGGPDWKMSDAAINAWLNLSVDIAKFYDFKEVKYQSKPANISRDQVETWIKTWSKPDDMIITIHNWYSAKPCPGPYFIRQLPWLVKEINKRLADPNYVPEAFVGEGATQTLATPSIGTKTISEIAQEVINGAWGNGQDRINRLTTAGYNPLEVQNRVNDLIKGSSPPPAQTNQNGSNLQANQPNDKVIWDFLKNKGLSDYAVAGIMGNLFAESGLRSNILQNTFKNSLKMTDDQYTNGVDNGSYKNFIQDKAGYGLVQWTFHSRKQALLNFAKTQRTPPASIGNLAMQLDFMWQEMSAYKDMIVILGRATNIREASNTFMINYLRPADQSKAAQDRREAFGEEYHRQFGNQLIVTPSQPSSPTTPIVPPTTPSTNKSVNYPVTIAASALNIRKGPGINHSVVQTLANDRNLYTIVEEAEGVGAKKWGRLKSGIGWISLDHVRRQ